VLFEKFKVDENEVLVNAYAEKNSMAGLKKKRSLMSPPQATIPTPAITAFLSAVI